MTRQGLWIAAIFVVLTGFVLWGAGSPRFDFWLGVFMLFAGVASGVILLTPRGRATRTPLDLWEAVVSAGGSILFGIGTVWPMPLIGSSGFALLFVACAINVYSRYGRSNIDSVPSK